jgi:hypothetical protein
MRDGKGIIGRRVECEYRGGGGNKVECGRSSRMTHEERLRLWCIFDNNC